MMSRFIAIPVAQGDAFYLEREGLSVLVDGGRNSSAFPALFQAATGVDHVNVMICTHNDADHANGILGFLEAGLRCDKLWLPGCWLRALPTLLQPFDGVFDQLLTEVTSNETASSNVGRDRQPNLSPIEIYAERLPVPFSDASTSDSGTSVGKDGWPESLLEKLEVAERWDVRFTWPLALERWNGSKVYWISRNLVRAQIELLWSAIEAAERIRDIATEAFHRGIPVHWFEFNTGQPSGGYPTLKPVNSKEIATVHFPTGPSILAWLALTVANRESLVFWSPPATGHPGVLFTADSDLKGAQLPQQLDGCIATAPHHGSEANANAYAVVTTAAAQNAALPIVWVRSDGRYRNRPGSTYLGLASSRFCTICRAPGERWTDTQAVHLYSSGGEWKPNPPSRMCSCQ